MVQVMGQDDFFDDDQVEEIFARQDKEVSFRPTTPGKRLKVEGFSDLEGIESPGDIWVDRLLSSSDDASDSFALVLANWNKLVDVVDRLRRSMPRLEYAVDAATTDTAGLIDSVDAKVTVLHAQAGTAPKGYVGVPAPDLWGSVSCLVGEIGELRTTTTAISGALRESREQMEKLRSQVVAADALTGRIDEVRDFVGTVITEVTFTQNELLKVQRAVEGGGDPASGMVVTELLGRIADLERKEVASESKNELLKEALERIGIMEMEAGNLRSTIGSEIVRIDDVPFHTSEDIAVWVEDKMGGQGLWDLFFDVTSMLETLQDISKGSTDYMTINGVAAKAGDESLIAGRMLGSFATTVPDLFNHKKTLTVPFSRLTDYKAWDARDNRKGLVPDVKKRLLQWKAQHLQRINTRLRSFPKARELAREMLQDSITFWQELVSWIEQFYGRLTSNEEEFGLNEANTQAERRAAEAAIAHSRGEAWDLIIKILDDLFQEMALRRSEGISAQDSRIGEVAQTAAVIYASLRAHKFMRELREKNFERHAVLTPTFNGFLFLERASHASVKQVADRVEVVAALATSLQGRLDQSAGGGGGRGGRGGAAGGRGAGRGGGQRNEEGGDQMET